MNTQASGGSFTYRSPIFFDEIDPMQMLHNTRYAVHVEHAVAAFWAEMIGSLSVDLAKYPDQFQLVREFHIEYLAPFRGPGELRIELRVEHLGVSSCSYGFTCYRGDDDQVLARGRRSVVRLDPATLKPAPWSAWFRESHRPLS